MTQRGVVRKYLEIVAGLNDVWRFRCGPVEIERHSDGEVTLSDSAARQIASALNEQDPRR